MPFQPGQSGNPQGKPKGAISKKVEFERFLFDNFIENKEKAQILLNSMYQNKQDFKWVMGLLTERMPKETSTEVTNTEKKIIIEIDKNDRKPDTQRLPDKVLQES